MVVLEICEKLSLPVI